MSSIKSIFNQLEATRSKNEKIAIITANIDSQDLRNCFYLAYNPYINFFIKKIPTVPEYRGEISLSDAIEMLEPLYTKQITGKKAREKYVVDLLSSLCQDDAEILQRVIVKNLKCGCSRNTFNKVKNIIPKFSCLLAKDYNDENGKKLKPPYYVQLKSDGSRACALVSHDRVTYRTREGNEYLMSVPHIDKNLIELRNAIGNDIMVDGEVVSINENGVCDRQKSNGIVNKAIVGSIKPEEEENIRFYIWDCIHKTDFDKGIDKTPYSERLTRLASMSGKELVADGLQVSPTHIVETLEEAEAIAERYIDSGEEGAMIKSHDLVWEDKRSYHIQKIKAENECDLEVITWKAPDQNKAMNKGIGSLLVQSKDGKVKVWLRSGITYEMVGYEKNEDGDYVFNESFDLDKYNGRIAKLVYNKRILNKDGDGYTLFAARFISFRDDKFEADTIDRIKE